LHNLIKLALGLLVALTRLLVLVFPLVALLLDALDLALKLLSANISLTQPDVSVHLKYVLLNGFTKVLVSGIELLFQHLNTALKNVDVRLVAFTLFLSNLGFT